MNTALEKNSIIRNLSGNSALLKKYSVKRIGLFGSCSRGTNGKNSDIDLLVSFKSETFDNYIGLLEALKKLFNRKVDLISVDAVKQNRKQYILKDIIWL